MKKINSHRRGFYIEDFTKYLRVVLAPKKKFECTVISERFSTAEKSYAQVEGKNANLGLIEFSAAMLWMTAISL